MENLVKWCLVVAGSGLGRLGSLRVEGKRRICRPWPRLCFVVALTAGSGFLLTSCQRAGPESKPPDVDYYTCTMHPSVKSQDPKAKCPICSMDLVPVKKKGGPTGGEPAGSQNPAEAQAGTEAARPVTGTNAAETTSEFVVPVERQQQIGVSFAPVSTQPFIYTVRTVGRIAYDERLQWDHVARVAGYVEKLFVFSPGETVEKGAPLLRIYSPDLFVAQNELVEALKGLDAASSKGDEAARNSGQRLVDSARQRLQLWDIDPDQIGDLEKTRRPQTSMTLNSPLRGVVKSLAVDQGQRVMPGDRVVEIADLSTVWVWARFYENELAILDKGLPVRITCPAFPGEQFTGRIGVIDPSLDRAMRTVRARIDMANPDGKLRPEMFVDVELEKDFGRGLAVPVSAVLPTGLRNLVFVDKGEGRLEPRFVELGRKFQQFFEVRAGLKADERVVTGANFLLDAEAQVQGAIRSW